MREEERPVMPRHNNDMTPADIAAILQSALRPLSEKVDDLLANRVTRADMEKLRAEITTGYVSRDVYEARHTSLIDRTLQLEAMIRELRKDVDADIQKIHDRLESGKAQLEARIIKHEEETGKKLDANDKAQLSRKDQRWLRLTQIGSGIAVAVTIIGLLLQHVKFF